MVLLHELSHVLRRDPMTHLAVRMALCLYWFHPLAWLAAREFLRERERACDDLVLEAGARPSRYASHLLEVATSLREPAAGWAALCMARRSQLEGRLVAILDSGVKRGAAGPAFAAAAALAVVMLVVPLAAMRPAPETVPPSTAAEMDALIRAALSARDHAMLDRTTAALVARHKYAEAERLAAAALEVRAARYGENSPEYAQGLIEEGKVRRAAGKLKQAEESYRKALALQPSGDAATLGFLALAAQHRRDFVTAVDLYQQALARQPEARERGRLLTGMASAQQQLDDRSTAEQSYRAALSLLDPGSGDYATTLELLSRLLTDTGRPDEAKPLEARAAQIRAALVRRGNVSPPPHQARRIGGGVTPPSLISKIEPKYSETARMAKYQGSVTLYIEIGPDGQVYQVELKRGLGMGLDEQAADAVRQWLFHPGMKDGAPVAVAATVEVNFRLM
jgi:TonB family protein